MRQLFFTPNVKDLRMTLTTDTIGNGKLGAKSAALRAHRSLFETSTVTGADERGTDPYLPHISVTPELLAGFLRRIGASHERPEDAMKAIEYSDFSSFELDAFSQAIAPFEQLYVAVRSDEATAAGVGLWHTDFVLVDKSSDTTDRVAKIVRKILQADFSRDVLAFKRRVGLPLEDTSGVFVMPVIGMNIDDPNIYGTPYHANVVTHFRGEDALVTIGAGIGGANALGPIPSLLSRLKPIHFNNDLLLMSIPSPKLLFEGELRMVNDIQDGGGIDHLQRILRLLCAVSINGMISNLEAILSIATARSKTPLYLELSSDTDQWVLLQCAELRLNEVKKPNVPAKQKIFEVTRNPHSFIPVFGLGVSGRQVIEAEHVVYVDERNTVNKLPHINKSLSNYVLIVDECTLTPFSFRNEVPFANYSNAAAIIFVHQLNRPIATHLGGIFREAGIPILAGADFNTKFLGGLEKGKVNNIKLVVYANDAEEEGFVATMD